MKIGQIHDITRLLSPQTLVYPGDVRPEFIRHDHGSYVTTELRMSTHSGTHIDVPSHFIRGGASSEKAELPHLLGPCTVLDVSHGEGEIGAAELTPLPSGTKRVLLKTSYSGERSFRADFRGLSLAAARSAHGSGLVCIGTDAPSIEAFEGDGNVHTLLLSGGCTVIELLDLSGVKAGKYFLIALPMLLDGLDGAPARVVLLEEEGPGDQRT